MSRRVALTGCGVFARNHRHAWTSLPGVEVAAGRDRDPARAETFAPDVGAAAHTDAAAMPKAVRPDLADIATTVPSQGKGTPRPAEVTLSSPLSTMGASLPDVRATVAGNLFELGRFSGLRRLGLRLPRHRRGATPLAP